MKRVFVLVLSVLAAWLTTSAPAVAEPLGVDSAIVHSYTYDAPAYDGPVAGAVSERGPPARCDRCTTYDAVDLRSHGISACPGETTTPAIYNYDDPARFVRTSRGSQGVDESAGGRAADYLVQRLRVAAKGAGEAGALVRYDAQAASRNLLGQVGDGYARTPSGYTVSAHAAERIVYGAPGRSPTTLGRVDDILNNPTRSVMRPDGSIRVFQGKDWVAVRGSGPIHIITVMVR